MAKQKIVVRVTMEDDKKTRKAMKAVVSVPGVESVTFVGPNKEQIAVTGEGIDSVELTCLLRKRVGHTELISVGPIEEKKKPAKPDQKDIPVWFQYGYPQPYYGHTFPLQLVHDQVPSYSCTIL